MEEESPYAIVVIDKDTIRAGETITISMLDNVPDASENVFLDVGTGEKPKFLLSNMNIDLSNTDDKIVVQYNRVGCYVITVKNSYIALGRHETRMRLKGTDTIVPYIQVVESGNINMSLYLPLSTYEYTLNETLNISFMAIYPEELSGSFTVIAHTEIENGTEDIELGTFEMDSSGVTFSELSSNALKYKTYTLLASTSDGKDVTLESNYPTITIIPSTGTISEKSGVRDVFLCADERGREDTDTIVFIVISMYGKNEIYDELAAESSIDVKFGKVTETDEETGEQFIDWSEAVRTEIVGKTEGRNAQIIVDPDTDTPVEEIENTVLIKNDDYKNLYKFSFEFKTETSRFIQAFVNDIPSNIINVEMSRSIIGLIVNEKKCTCPARIAIDNVYCVSPTNSEEDVELDVIVDGKKCGTTYMIPQKSENRTMYYTAGGCLRTKRHIVKSLVREGGIEAACSTPGEHVMQLKSPTTGSYSNKVYFTVIGAERIMIEMSEMCANIKAYAESECPYDGILALFYKEASQITENDKPDRIIYMYQQADVNSAMCTIPLRELQDAGASYITVMNQNFYNFSSGVYATARVESSTVSDYVDSEINEMSLGIAKRVTPDGNEIDEDPPEVVDGVTEYSRGSSITIEGNLTGSSSNYGGPMYVNVMRENPLTHVYEFFDVVSCFVFGSSFSLGFDSLFVGGNYQVTVRGGGIYDSVFSLFRIL